MRTERGTRRAGGGRGVLERECWYSWPIWAIWTESRAGCSRRRPYLEASKYLLPKERKIIRSWLERRPHFAKTHILIHNDPKMETTQGGDGWTDKRDVVHPYNGILFGPEKERNPGRCYNTVEPPKHTKWSKPVTKGHVSYDPTYKTHQIHRVAKPIETESRMIVTRSCR